MKSLRKVLILFFLTVTCFSALILSVSASHMEYEGLEITIEMDKEVYDDGEPMTATITVKNTSTGTTTISNLEQLIPEGYRLAENSEASMKDVTLRGGQAIIMKVTFVEDISAMETTTEDAVKEWILGEVWGIPNLLWGFILLIAVVVFMLLT